MGLEVRTSSSPSPTPTNSLSRTMDDTASRSSRAYSVSAARAFPSVDYGVASPTPDLAALDVSPAAVPDPFDLSGDDDDADDSSQPTPTNTFFAFRNEASSSRPGSRSTSRANSRIGSRAVSPSAAAGTSLADRDRSTSRVSSRRPSNAGSTTSAAQGSRGPLSAPQLTSPSLFLPLPNVSSAVLNERHSILTLSILPTDRPSVDAPQQVHSAPSPSSARHRRRLRGPIGRTARHGRQLASARPSRSRHDRRRRPGEHLGHLQRKVLFSLLHSLLGALN